jgi:hypothetical protein
MVPRNVKDCKFNWKVCFKLVTEISQIKESVVPYEAFKNSKYPYFPTNVTYTCDCCP